MSDTLLIHFDINSPHQATWSTCNAAGELTGKICSGPLQELSALVAGAEAGRHATVLLNSACLHINQLQLPTKNLQKLLKAVPYAIEEYIADDVDDLHFVIRINKQNNATDVVAIKKQTLQDIINIFHSLNIVIDSIIPDALCLPASEHDKQWACLNFNDISYLQTESANGMCYSHQLIPYLLKNKLADENLDRPEKILLFCEQENSGAFESIIKDEDINSKDIEFINITYNSHPLVIFCGQYRQAASLNLLQGKFKPKRKTSGYWHHWRLAASLVAVWLVLHLGLSSVKLSNIREENNITRAKIENIYKKSFPESSKIVNPRVQMEQKLKQLKSNIDSGSNGFIFLLAETFATFSENKDAITVQSLTFRNNRMDIGIDGSNLQSIENLNNKLNSNPQIKAEITSSSAEKDKVKGQIRIEGRS